jgi:hypothetical protein
MLMQYGLENCKPAPTPMTPSRNDKNKAKHEITTSNEQAIYGFKIGDDKRVWNVSNFSKMVGALLYLAVTTRPDISYAVMALTKKMQSPTNDEIVQVKRIMRYLKGTIDQGLFYSKNETTTLELQAYSDADWADDRTNGRSHTGMAIMMGNCVISWMAKQQPIVAQSTSEAEFIAANEVGREVVWLRLLLEELGAPQKGPTDLFVDNQTAVAMANVSGTNHTRRKHIMVKYFWLREKVDDGTLAVSWVPTDHQQADIFTKPLVEDKFIDLKEKLVGGDYMAMYFN